MRPRTYPHPSLQAPSPPSSRTMSRREKGEAKKRCCLLGSVRVARRSLFPPACQSAAPRHGWRLAQHHRQPPQRQARQQHTDHRGGEYVAGIVQPQYHARKRHAGRKRHQQRGEPGIIGQCTMLKDTACNVWPEGKLNSSSGATQARMRTSAAYGRGRRVQRLSALYSVNASTPVAAMCADARTPCMPSSTTSNPIKAYQNTPSPRRLMEAKTRRTGLRRHHRLARRHQRAS